MAFAIAASFAACKGKTDTTTTNSVAVDTTGDYQRRLADTAATITSTPVNDDTIVTSDGGTYVKVDPATERVAPKSNASASTRKRTAGSTSRAGTTPRKSRSGSGTASSGSGTASTGGSGTSTSEEPAVTPQPEEKKGWSNAAKGAVIGGAGGAVTGAIISKKKGKGAIIGGVVGAAGGYILGRKKDKKASRDTTY